MSRGFTLVEVMLAVAIGGALLVGVLAYLSGVRNLRRMAEENAETFQKAQFALSQIEKDLRAAYASDGPLSAGFHGEDSPQSEPPLDTLEMVAATNDPYVAAAQDPTHQLKTMDLQKVEYRIVEGRGLVRTRMLNLLASITMEGTLREEEICPDAGGLNFRYHDGAGWYDSWDLAASGTLPRAVEATLYLPVKRAGREETRSFRTVVWLPVGQTFKQGEKR